LVNSNVGIAVSMASNVCSFNLTEVCDAAIALIKNRKTDITDILKGPDFAGGGYLLYNEEETRKIYDTGRGNFTVRAKWNFDRESNCIEITRIPSTTTVEAIMDKIIELVKAGRLQGISYIRDETDIGGLKLAIDIKRGTDPERLMKKLYKLTPLQENYPCNFNILIAGTPKVMGVYEILEEWTAFRTECVKRRVYFGLNKKKNQLHLLTGLKKILLDIDRAIEIVRETDEEAEVIPNLMIGFGIDEIQAEYVAEIKLRHLNRQYILNRISEIEQLKKDIAEMEDILASDKRIKEVIIEELREVKKKYAQPRKTELLYEYSEDTEEEDDTPDYPVTVFITKQGYIKKITAQSLKNSGEQKLKEGDEIASVIETMNSAELLFFSDRGVVYKMKASAFSDMKVAVMGDFIPSKAGFDEGENFVYAAVTLDFSGYFIFVFENGKCAKVPLDSYKTVTNRKKLLNAYSEKSPLVSVFTVSESTDIFLTADNGKGLLYSTGMIAAKQSKNTDGVQVMTLRNNAKITAAVRAENADKYKAFTVKNIPSAGSKIPENFSQITFGV
jgi:DNA gyrase subunit A